MYDEWKWLSIQCRHQEKHIPIFNNFLKEIKWFLQFFISSAQTINAFIHAYLTYARLLFLCYLLIKSRNTNSQLILLFINMGVIDTWTVHDQIMFKFDRFKYNTRNIMLSINILFFNISTYFGGLWNRIFL